ncbi:HAMP domain-containing sensor histidine kinase [Streptomyces aculeolatus]
MPRRTFSARSRIVGWMLLLVGAALAAPTMGITVIWLAEIDTQVDQQLRRKADELRRFARTAQDPATGRPFTRGADLLTQFMTVNLPTREEAYFSIVDGRADRRSANAVPARLDRDPEVVVQLARPVGTEVGWLDSRAGKVRYGVVPVRVAGDPSDTRLVVLEFRDRHMHEDRWIAEVLLLTGVPAFLLAAAAGWVLAGRVLAPVRLVRKTAERISESDLTQRLTVTGADDVAELAHTFNHMLDRLESAFTTQRQFLNEVAHELRTPITVIRGNLELMDDDAKRAGGQTYPLVLDELQRMTRIVDDLLLLAKVKRPDFLTVGETDLTDLIIDVVMKARALGDRQWRIAHVAEATVLVDRQRLTQALIQLALNAVQHTREGDLIEMGSVVRARHVVLWVRDTGPGVAPQERLRIFDRFARGSGTGTGTGTGTESSTGTGSSTSTESAEHPGHAPRSGTPDTRDAGLGLGLAIVQAIAQAHGGSARVDDADGAGARFTILLPARFPWQGGHHAPDTHCGGRSQNRRLRRKGSAYPWLRHLRRH